MIHSPNKYRENEGIKICHYFKDMLTWDMTIIPNASAEDMKTARFKKEQDKVYDFFDEFDYKREFRKVLLGMIIEDAKYVTKLETIPKIKIK